ncbi:MAG TPA: Wzz/FepE/Etk N-terminal domain-containing protein [Desulfitobacteriaceae bacterium]|nr:Wzz/FepE/Etk N-terminal domain-containing protein [Desulfitobacteriaceae bacterium]
MEIKQYFYALVRKWWLLAILVALGGLLSYLSVVLAPPMYKADSTLYIMNRSKVLTTGQTITSQDLVVSQLLVKQYTAVIYSRSVISAVAQALDNQSITEENILSMIGITSETDSNILTISAQWYDPVVAAEVANHTGQEFVNQIRKLTNSDNISILDEAVVPDTPVSNKKSLKVLIGLLAGFLIAAGSIYVMEYFDTTVRSVEDIEKSLGLRVIGIIPEHDIA